jgi:hypothetical protein
LTLWQTDGWLAHVQTAEATRVVTEVIALIEQNYLDQAIATEINQTLRSGLAEGRYRPEAQALAEAVTTDLQSVNDDKHLRLIFHADSLPEREPGDDKEEYAAFARWAEQTCCGIARVERLGGNVGYLDVQPVLFPASMSGDAITAALSILASTDALIIDLRHCIGGEPAAVAWLASYLFGSEPVELTGLVERGRLTQGWTLAHVPGRRFGPTKPVFVLTSHATFSGGEQLSYDLQQLGRATIVGEPTGGGANARQGFRVHPHLEATISVARGLNPISGTNWEGTGVAPDVAIDPELALDHAHQLAVSATLIGA